MSVGQWQCNLYVAWCLDCSLLTYEESWYFTLYSLYMHLIYVAAVVCELAQSRHLKLADWCIIFWNSCKAWKKVQNHWGEDVISFTKDVESTRKLYRYVLHYHLSSSLSHRICFALWHWNTKSSCFLVFNSFIILVNERQVHECIEDN